MSDEYRFIGKATPRGDALDIVTGRTKFVGDIKQYGMLYGKVLRSPHPHANIRSIDTAKAKRLRGVEAVLTHEDVPNWRGGVPAHLRVLDSKVRFVGDAVALIAARTEEIAAEARELIEVDYEVLPAVYDVVEAMKPDAPRLHAAFPGNVVPPGFPWFGPHTLQEVVIGDVEKGFEEADIVVEGACAYENFPNPLPPEPPGVIAAWEGADALTIWTASQGTFTDRTVLYYILGRKVNVRAHGVAVGGSYGSKNTAWLLIVQAAVLSLASGKPVKLCYTKEEQFAAFTLRLGSRIQARIGMKKDGTVTAISGDWLVNTGYYCAGTQGQVAVGCGEIQLVVRCPNWNLKPKVVCTNRAPSGIVRGYGGQELKCAFLPILTMALEKADLDPVEFFKNNYVKPGDGYYWRDGEWWVSNGVDYTKAIEEGAKAFGWKEKWKGWLKPTAVSGTKRIGVGVGVHGNADVGEDTSEAYVRLDPEGTATLYSSISEHGTGQRSSLCKMVAEVLQLPLERVSMTPPDSLANPYEFGTVGSRGTFAVGSAVIEATEDARRKLLELAAQKLDRPIEDLETADGVIYVRPTPEIRLPWKAVMGFDRTCLGHGRFEPNFTMPNFMMVFAEVEVDVETGQVALLRVGSATDVGQIIDPLNLENQLNGSLGSAGIDSAIFEETILDRATGRVMGGNMIDFKWRTFAELPPMQHVVLETPFPSHRFKAIGVGEITPSPGPAAVIMAISNAVGVRFYDYPITPDKILKALGKVQGRKARGGAA
ncbi:MAG: xanthine dehydrogenase family protein molybdopterin-binding subunit [Chloroflexi bacterium]|nr:xanthine dehydrogenase family protein molybdopterin-binding subunit [Chloroflexota bacterium]